MSMKPVNGFFPFFFGTTNPSSEHTYKELLKDPMSGQRKFVRELSTDLHEYFFSEKKTSMPKLS